MPHAKLAIGNVEITVVHDAEVIQTLERGFPNVPEADWAPYIRRYPEAFSGGNMRRTHFECYVVRSEGRTILVDSGLGDSKTNPGTVTNVGGGVEGNLPNALEEAGFKTTDFDTVFLTHLHPDHVGWNVTRNGEEVLATFPNARYIGHEADWAAFNTPLDSEIFGFDWWADTVTPLKGMGVLDLVTGKTELTGELTLVPTPGHTPGAMSMIIESSGEKAFLMGDVFHGPAQVTETKWSFRFDADPEQAIRTRENMLERAENEDAVIAIYHHSGFGRVIREQGRRYWKAL